MRVECNASRVTWQEQRSSNSKEEKLYSRLYITSGYAHEMKTSLHHFTFFATNSEVASVRKRGKPKLRNCCVDYLMAEIRAHLLFLWRFVSDRCLLETKRVGHIVWYISVGTGLAIKQRIVNSVLIHWLRCVIHPEAYFTFLKFDGWSTDYWTSCYFSE